VSAPEELDGVLPGRRATGHCPVRPVHRIRRFPARTADLYHHRTRHHFGPRSAGHETAPRPYRLFDKALRPVDAIGRQAAAIPGTDLQRRFVADSAHELRTPLAALRARMEIDLRHPEPGRQMLRPCGTVHGIRSGWWTATASTWLWAQVAPDCGWAADRTRLDRGCPRAVRRRHGLRCLQSRRRRVRLSPDRRLRSPTSPTRGDVLPRRRTPRRPAPRRRR
jgi:signal transduction histidine kinase